MNIYILTETDSADTSYVYNEAYLNINDAKERLRHLYHDLAIEGDPDNIASSTIDFDFQFAKVENNDGTSVYWHVKEVELY